MLRFVPNGTDAIAVSETVFLNYANIRGARARSETHEYINGTQPHGNGLWVHSSAATLQLPRPGAGVRRSIGVTPQILSRPLVAALARHLDHLLAEEVVPAANAPPICGDNKCMM